MNDDLKNQSNPFSTGGGGVNFETRVQAAFAISLLTQTCVPCLSQNMKVKELRFQNKYDGANTDDFVLLASDKEGNESKLFAQIKHEISIGDSTDSIFSEVIKSAWGDFKSDKFNAQNDSIALITGPLSKSDVHNVLPVLEWANCSSCASDFIKKSTTKGFTSEAKKNKLRAFKSQLISANKGVAVSDDELWQFLRVFYIIPYDLDAKHSVVSSLLCSHIKNYSKESPSLVLSRVITCVQEFNQNAGVLTLSNIPVDVSSLFSHSDSNSFDDDITRLRERGDYIFAAISSEVKSFHIRRDDQLAKISEQFGNCGFIFVTGARGIGKSSIVKDFVATKSKDVPVFYLRAEDLDKSHLNDVFTSIGMHCTLGQIAGKFSLLKEKILVIESVEKVLELTYQNAFVDLLEYIKNQTGWTIIATGRDYAYQQIAFNYLQPSGTQFNSINIDGFNKAQIDEICEHIPELKALTSNDLLVDLLKVPFFIEIAVRAIDNGAKFHSGDTESDFRNTVWTSVISKETDRKAGMHARRKLTFIEVAKQRAKKMVFGIRDIGFDPEVISKLEEDNLIQRDSRLALISPSHDVLEDWALEEFIEGEYIDNSSDLCRFLSSIGNEPSINRAFRLWLYRRLKIDVSINEFINGILTSDSIDNYWKDETIAAILQSSSASHFLRSLKSQLLKDDCALLTRFFFILRISCQRPNSFNQVLSKDEKSGLFKSLFLQPYGDGWESLINFTYEVRNELSNSVLPHIVEVLEVWSGLINIYDALPKASTKVGLLALWLLVPIKDSYRNEGKRKKILNVLLKVSPAIEAEFDELMGQDVFISKLNPRRLGYVDELSSLALVGVNVPILCKHHPEFVVRLSLHEWLQQNPEEDEHGYRSYRMGVDEYFGLDNERDFFPASGAKGPFKYLLQYHPRLALDFIIKLCNLTAQKYSESEFGSLSGSEPDLAFYSETAVKQIEFSLNDGSVVNQFASPHLWKGYRGLSTLPYLLQCALMALEGWLIDYVSECGEDNEIEWIFNYLLRSSNSVMPTSVLASVATGFPTKVGQSAFPILKCPELYQLDLQRMTGEMGGSELNWFAYRRDVMSEIYVEERRKAALRPWRKESLETLLTRLQFDANHREGALRIVDELIAFASERDEEYLRFMVHRIDTRTWEAIEDKENNRILFQSNPDLPEDIKQIQSEYNSKHIHDNSVTKLHLWARKLFEENIQNEEYFSSYEEALEAAKNILIALQNNEIYTFSDMAVGTIAFTAAVCVRDVLGDLSSEDKEWCLGIILESVLMHSDVMYGTTAYDKTDHYGSGACAFVLSKFFECELSEEQTKKLKYAIATAITHSNLNVSAFAAKGIREFLWVIDSNLASMCIAGAIAYAQFRSNEIKSRRLHYLNSEELERAKENWHHPITAFRNDFFNKGSNLSVSEISLESHSPWFIHLPMLMVPYATQDSKQVSLIQTLVKFVFDDEYRDHSSNDEKINHDIKIQIQDCFTQHIIQSKNNNFLPFKDLLAEGCLKAPSIIYFLKLSFDVAMERKSDLDAIWTLWAVLAPEAHKIALNDINDRYTGLQNDLNKLLRGIMYSDTPWQGHENEEKIMSLGAVYLLEFARISANNSHVFEALSSLMYHFHELFYDEGIYILADKLSNDSALVPKQINTAYYLEMSIGRYLQIVNRGILSRKMYNACIQLLTGVVETGSARAYYLRENLIRSRRISV
jgi:hypothetical protein